MAQATHPDHSGAAIVFNKVEPYGGGVLIVTSEAVDADGWLSGAHSQAEDETSPPLSWEAPSGIVSYVLIVQDPDAPMKEPAVHWIIWNMPGSLHSLPADLGKTATPDRAGGAIQGLNSRGEPGWLGMAPPVGHGPHRYYFQLFGLDRRLDLPPDTPLSELTNILKGSTVVKGQLIGKYEVKDPVFDATSPARTGSYGVNEEASSSSSDSRQSSRGDRDDADRRAPPDASEMGRPV